MMEPIRVLQIVGTMNRGGAETLIMELYRHIDKTKVQFDFLIFSYGNKPGVFDKEIEDYGGRIYYVNKRLYREPIAYEKDISEFARQHKEYKIVHSHLNMRGGFVINQFKKISNSCVIAHSHTAFPHTDIKNRLVNYIGKRFLDKYADYFFACSEEAMKAICGKGADGITRFLIHNGIDIEKFQYSNENRKKIRCEFGLSDNCFVVTHIGRFTSEKNHKFVIEIFKEITKTVPNSRLILVGEGDLFHEVKQEANELDINDRITFAGSRGDVNDILSASDVFLFPSKGEGLGIVVIEAQANGLPCIISKDVIPDEVNVHSGLLTRISLNESAKKWADACVNVPKRIDGAVARKAIIDSGYDIRDIAHDLQDFYLSHWRE